jgi:hypothetical protein
LSDSRQCHYLYGRRQYLDFAKWIGIDG